VRAGGRVAQQGLLLVGHYRTYAAALLAD